MAASATYRMARCDIATNIATFFLFLARQLLMMVL
jgi:hypothetical protein